MSRAGFTLPNTFATKTVKGPLSDLDANFNPLKNAILDSGNGWVNWSTVGGTVNAITLTNTPPCLTLNSGATFIFKVTGPNTGATTINVDGIGAQSVINPATGNPLVGGELTGLTTVVYVSGTGFYVTNGITISGVRYNAIGNPNFEVDQRNVFSGVVNITNGAFAQDRWAALSVGTLKATTQAFQGQVTAVIPGTSFLISQGQLNIQVATAEPTLAAGDYWALNQSIEGPFWRELSSDVSSVSILCQASVPLSFALSLRSQNSGVSLVKLCNIPVANVWTLITLPNIPKPTTGTFGLTPGTVGYTLSICLACGSTFTAPALNTWQTGNFLGAPGMSNMFATTGTNFICAFVQHEPGPICTSLIDKPFSQNYQECLRYYCKSWAYSQSIGAASSYGEVIFYANQASFAMGYAPFPVPLAKSPTTVNIYGSPTGTINQAQSYPGAVNTAISSSESNERAISYITGTLTSAQMYRFHYTADTGW